MGNVIGIGDFINLEKFLKGEPYEINNEGPMYYAEDMNSLVVDQSRIFVYRKAPELTGPRFIEDIKLLETMANRYLPIIDKESREIFFSKDEFINYRKRMSGLKKYGTGDYQFADSLEFPGLEYYLGAYDKNVSEVNYELNPVIEEFKRVMSEIGLTTTVGLNTDGDIELVEAGSTSRYTNIPSVEGTAKWDFDFTVRMDPDKVWVVKEALETKLQAKGHITRTSAYKVRLTDVTIPGLDKPLDLDFSLTPQKKNYLATEEALSERLNGMRELDEEKYRLVVANIQYAKALLKKAGAYKPSRGILEGDRDYGGIGGVGIENWILQYGGSFEAAARDFLAHAEGKSFIDFEKEYAIMDFGQDHVSTSKGEFPFHNFIMRNMRWKGFELMRDTLREFINELDQNKGVTL